MCTFVLLYNQHPGFPIIFAGNRDEFRARPTQKAHWWQQPEGILAGRDLKQGGTWTGVNRHGAFAALTNYRQLIPPPAQAVSRGSIITSFLTSNHKSSNFLHQLENSAQQYEGYNVLFGTLDQLFFFANAPKPYHVAVPAGIHAVSNGMWNENWPKVKDLKTTAANWLSYNELPVAKMFDDLTNSAIYPDYLLPKTGISEKWERKLSALYVEGEEYGTRSSTILAFSTSGQVYYWERTHSKTIQEEDFMFNIGL